MSAYKIRIQELTSAVDAEVIDLKKLRKLVFSGCPESSGVRSKCWKILLYYLPKTQSEWTDVVKKQRESYLQFVNEMIIKPGQEASECPGMSDVTFEDHPLNPNPDSKWRAYFKDNEMLLQIDKDCRRLCPDLNFFQCATDHPLKDLCADLRMDTLRKRVEQCVLQSESVSQNRLGITNERLCPDLNFFQCATDHPLKDLCSDLRMDTLRKRVEQCVLQSESVSQNRLGITNMTMSRRKQSDEYMPLVDGQEAHWEVCERILFVYAKLNPGVGYIQGMNEILGPLYYTFASDPDPDCKKYAEADSFFCFTNLMSEIRDNFIKSLDDSQCGIGNMMSSLMTLLKNKDSTLWYKLQEQELRPQFYAFRWLTLMLSQEFPLPDVLRIWDSLFADEKRFSFLIKVACAMLLLLKDELMVGDFPNNMKLVQNFQQTNIDVSQVIKKAVEISRRCSDIQALRLGEGSVNVQRQGLTFVRHGLAKQDREGHYGTSIFIPTFKDNKKLDPKRSMYYYLMKTESFRKKADGSEELSVFLSLNEPHKPVSSQTISNWIVQTIKMCLGDNSTKIKGHSTRAIGTSYALFKGASLSSILSAADWSRESTFVKFYLRDMSSQS